MTEPRYYVGEVSVGVSGPTPRPAVINRASGRRVHTYKRGERRLAEKMAAKLNAELQAR